MDTYKLGVLVSMLALFLGWATTNKYKVGPCLFVTDAEPCPDAAYISVYLYTKKNPNSPQRINFDDKTDNLEETNFEANIPNKIIIHGFFWDMCLNVLQDIKQGYMNVAEDYNVFMVNYPKYVHSMWCYPSAVNNIQHVGKCVAQFVDALRRRVSNAHVHVIGFSLGAQLANFIARNLDGPEIDRITGLDPAGPGFLWRAKSKRLDPSDAKFVDVIHTNGGIKGYVQTCGHVDFYVNGGSSQPGCINNRSDYLSCNHRRAPMYFAESITTTLGFYGWKCAGYVNVLSNNCEGNNELILMGENVPIGTKGIYMVQTNSTPPFALGKSCKIR